MKKTLPGLKNFYMAGQWVEPGGSIPKVILSGRNVTQVIYNPQYIIDAGFISPIEHSHTS